MSDFLDLTENLLINNNIILDGDTTDIYTFDNDNTFFLVSFLNEFLPKKNISLELMETFLKEIAQRVVWENILEYDEAYIREPFTLSNEKNFILDVPIDYKIVFENNSIIEILPLVFDKYLKEKFKTFDFNMFNTIAERKNSYDLCLFYIKMLVYLDCIFPDNIKKMRDNLIEILSKENKTLNFENIFQKLKDKVYIGLIWEKAVKEYIKKNDKEFLDVFSQNWSFAHEYIKKFL